jgi:hypothetical protein
MSIDQTLLSQKSDEAPRPGRPAPRDCGSFDIHISRDGSWFYRGSPIKRLPLVKLFSTVLKRESDGSYWLETPVEKGRVTVEDAPFVAVELSVEEAARGRQQRLIFRTNVDDSVAVDTDHPLRVESAAGTDEPRPYVMVRRGLEARLLRSVFYQLVDLGMEERVGDKAQFGVWSNGTFFPLGRLDTDG